MTPEQKALEEFAGTWDVEERYDPSPFLPQGGEGKGVARHRIGPAGILVEDYESTTPAGTFAGHGVVTWEPKERAYVFFWWDDKGSNGEAARGHVDGERIVYEISGEHGGKRLTLRRTIGDRKPGHFTWTFELTSDDGKTWQRSMVLTYRRRPG